MVNEQNNNIDILAHLLADGIINLGEIGSIKISGDKTDPKTLRSILNAEFKELEKNNIDQLREKWRKFYDCRKVPPYSKTMMIHKLANRLQELAYGGMSKNTTNLLNQYVDTKHQRKKIPYAPGTVLIKYYQGSEYKVYVEEDGFLYKDKKYKTLSTIAKHITGKSWSGNRFFGLEKL